MSTIHPPAGITEGADREWPAGARLDDQERVSLCEALDRVLNKGAVIVGEAVISVADVDLIYLGLQLVLTSVARGQRPNVTSGPASRGAVRSGIGLGSGVTDGPH
ncbi:MAG: gas vesicle protein [Armatimonadetes bacterium]|nr:gas vesicle protein [Armatimonadota bacterium]